MAKISTVDSRIFLFKWVFLVNLLKRLFYFLERIGLVFLVGHSASAGSFVALYSFSVRNRGLPAIIF